MNIKRKDYRLYGGRGITVCDRWNSFSLFAADVGPHPGKGWTLDRKDSNDVYRPGNTRWATVTTQNRNRRPSTRSGKLTLQQVADIRAKFIRGARNGRGGNTTALAKEYGVTSPLIGLIVRGKSWK